MKKNEKELSLVEQLKKRGWASGRHAVQKEYKTHRFKGKSPFYVQSFIESYERFSACKKFKALELDKAVKINENKGSENQFIITEKNPIDTLTNSLELKSRKNKNPVSTSKPIFVANKMNIKTVSNQPIYKHSVKNTLFGTYVCDSQDSVQNQPED